MLLEEGRREHNMSAYGCCLRKTTGGNIRCIPFIPAKRRTLCDMGHVTGYSKSRLKKKRKRLAQFGLVREANAARNQSSCVSRKKKRSKSPKRVAKCFNLAHGLQWYFVRRHFIGGTSSVALRRWHLLQRLPNNANNAEGFFKRETLIFQFTSRTRNVNIRRFSHTTTTKAILLFVNYQAPGTY